MNQILLEHERHLAPGNGPAGRSVDEIISVGLIITQHSNKIS